MSSAAYELKAEEASAPIEPPTPSQEEIRGDTRWQSYRYDGVLWSFGLLFLSILLSLIFGIGAARGWDAASGFTHHLSNTSMERFLPEPYKPEPGVYKRSDIYASQRWYYWKAKPEQVTTMTKMFPWLCYSVHMLSVWLVLYLQHKAKSFPDATSGKYTAKYSSIPDKYNIILFSINVLFFLIHLVNTHTTYDSLAGDITEATAQCSFIVVFVLIIIIEFKDRGVVFGYPTPVQLKGKQDSVWLSPVYLIRKYHGYFIYWATVSTLWYHPFENTAGHACGISHVWFMCLQGSLVFTKFHLNRYWRFILETWVIIHSGVVAVQVTDIDPNSEKLTLWPMFVFRFATVTFLTQAYGLPFWKNMPSWARAIPMAIYIVILLTAYNFLGDKQGRIYTRMLEVVRIPGIIYLSLLFAWLAIVLVAKIQRVHESRKSEDLKDEGETTGTPSTRPSLIKEILLISAMIFIYVVCVFLIWIVEYLDWHTPLLTLMFVLTFCFIFLGPVCGTFIFTQLIPMKKKQ